jgi:cytochrome c biogenesis protein CcmG/thiol:disulfide interchange protein DsbE
MTRPIWVAATVGVVLLLAVLLRSPAPEQAVVGTGTEAPELRAYTVTSPREQRSITDYRGQVVLLNVWATWCPPCREEMPSLQALHESLVDRGLRVVAVSIDDPGSEADIGEFVHEHGLTFEILHDDAAAIMNRYRVGGVPQTFLIDRDGRIRYKSYFTDWRTDENRTRVEELLAEDS